MNKFYELSDLNRVSLEKWTFFLLNCLGLSSINLAEFVFLSIPLFVGRTGTEIHSIYVLYNLSTVAPNWEDDLFGNYNKSLCYMTDPTS